MAEVKWQSFFETGIFRIDEQHQELIGIMNRLDRSLQSDDGPEAIEAALLALVSFADRHFAAEEAIMQETGYLDRERHGAIHHRIRMQMTGMLNRTGSPVQTTANEVLSFLSDWLLDHIVTEDKKIAMTAKVSLR